MRGFFVVVFIPRWELLDDGSSIGEAGRPDVIALECLHEGFCHAITFRAVRRRGADLKSQQTPHLHRFMSNKAGTVVTETLDGLGERRQASKPRLDTFDHQILNHHAIDPNGRCNLAQDSSVTSVEREDDMNSVAVPALNRERIRAPARVAMQSDDLAVMDAVRSSRVPL